MYILKVNDSFNVTEFTRFFVELLLTLNKEGDFLGPTWFLGALFTESILYKILDVAFKPFKYRQIILLGGYIIRAVFGFEITLSYKLSRTFILGMFFVVGYIVKENIDFFKKFNGYIAGLIAGVIFFVVSSFTVVRLSYNEFTSPLLYVMGAFAGCYFLIYVSQLIERCNFGIAIRVRKALCFLSRRSIDIVIWHMTFFRIVIGIQLLYWAGSLDGLLQHFPVYVSDRGWWVAYVVVGTIVPLLWCAFLRIGPWGKLLKKMHVL